MKKYIIMYKKLETTIKEIYVFKTFFAFVTTKARLYKYFVIFRHASNRSY